MKRLARIISNISIPPVFAAIVFVVLSLHLEQTWVNKVSVLVICIAAAVILPVWYLVRLAQRGEVSSLHVPVRHERTRPYLIGALCYFAGLIVLLLVGARQEIWGLMWCYFFNTLIITLINLKWKMSAHAMGAAGALAGVHFVFGNSVAPFYLLLPIIGWARLELKAHTLNQIIAGAAAGLFLTLGQLHLLATILQ